MPALIVEIVGFLASDASCGTEVRSVWCPSPVHPISGDRLDRVEAGTPCPALETFIDIHACQRQRRSILPLLAYLEKEREEEREQVIRRNAMSKGVSFSKRACVLQKDT